MATGEIQMGQSSHHIDLAVVLGQATSSGLLKTELLLDHPEWVLHFQADVGLGDFDQILQPALRRIPQNSAFARSVASQP